MGSCHGEGASEEAFKRKLPRSGRYDSWIAERAVLSALKYHSNYSWWGEENKTPLEATHREERLCLRSLFKSLRLPALEAQIPPQRLSSGICVMLGGQSTDEPELLTLINHLGSMECKRIL